MKTAADLLKSKLHQTVFTIAPASSVFEAVQLMADKNIGALLVIHLLAEQDPDALRRRWTPLRQINDYVTPALGVQAQAATRAARIAIENEIIETISDGSSGHGGGSDESPKPVRSSSDARQPTADVGDSLVSDKQADTLVTVDTVGKTCHLDSSIGS